MQVINVAFLSQTCGCGNKGYIIELVSMAVAGRIPIQVTYRESIVHPMGINSQYIYQVVVNRLVKLSHECGFVDVALSNINDELKGDVKLRKEFNVHNIRNPNISPYVYD